MYKIDDFNREIIIDRYVDDIVGNLHFLETKELLKDYLLAEKHKLTNEELEYEVTRHAPEVLSDIYIEEIIEEASHAQII